MLILGIDPGPAENGWAIIDCENRRPAFVEGGKADIDWTLRRAAAPDIDLVAVEWPQWTPIRSKNQNPAAVRGMARCLLDTALVAGRVAGLAEGAGKRVARLTSKEVRRAICRKQNARDAAVKAALQLVVDGMPHRSNVHVRDAMAVAIVGARAAA